MRFTVYLDFDGVLHALHAPAERLFEHRDVFEKVILAAPGVEVVISSSWRERRTLDELKALFSPAFAERIVGATPVLRGYEFWPYTRQCECEAWMRQAGRILEPWLALDDSPHLFRPFCQNLLATDPARGLDSQALQALADRLSSADQTR